MIAPVAVLFPGVSRCAAQREKPMSIVRISAAIVVLTGVLAMPAQAQQVMSEPAYCAFFYPNANCQNKGPGNPYTDPNYRRDGGLGSGQWLNAPPGPAPRRTHRHNATARM
jgi:hypothetical protein